MRYPSQKPSPPKFPEWVVRVMRSLRGKLAPDAYQRAINILIHPKTKEAREILNRAWTGEYPAFAEIIMGCALNNGPGKNVPFILSDKREQAKQAKAARGLLKAMEHLSRFGGGYIVRDGALFFRIFSKLGGVIPFSPELDERSRQEAENETPNISDAAIVGGLRITAEFLEGAASAPRDKGRPEDLRVRNVLASLDSRLTKDFGDADRRVVACLLKATFPEKKRITTDNIRNLLKYIRKK